jgi:hypothetical protein
VHSKQAQLVVAVIDRDSFCETKTALEELGAPLCPVTDVRQHQQQKQEKEGENSLQEVLTSFVTIYLLCPGPSAWNGSTTNIYDADTLRKRCRSSPTGQCSHQNVNEAKQWHKEQKKNLEWNEISNRKGSSKSTSSSSGSFISSSSSRRCFSSRSDHSQQLRHCRLLFVFFSWYIFFFFNRKDIFCFGIMFQIL